MLRAGRSAAATADGAATESLLHGAAQTSSVALILRVASRRDALNEEPASFPPGLIQIKISMVVAHSPRPPPWPCNYRRFVALSSAPRRLLLLRSGCGSSCCDGAAVAQRQLQLAER